MSKQEIIDQIEAALKAEKFEPNRNQFADWNSTFEKLREESEKAQREAVKDEQDVEKDFEYKPEPEDIRFKELCAEYSAKRKQLELSKKAELENNLAEKKALIKELDSLIKDEENIGKAYARFNAIKQKWNEVGPVVANQRRDIQGEYSRLIEQFYYNINIYRELQQNDLRKNQDLKLEVIEKIQALKDEKSIHQLDFLIHQYLDEWDTIGPTFKEEWEKIREQFKESVNAVFERLREHRKSVKSEHKANLERKRELVEKVKVLAEPDITDHKNTQERTHQIINLQKEWKKIGFAGHKHNDTVWREFREACDVYFNKRKAYLDKNSEKFAQIRQEKKALVDRAKAIHTETQSAEVANELKSLQRKWKEIGKLLPQEEYRLFKEFRQYCDSYFKGKKNAAKELEKEWKANLHQKEELIVRFTQEIDSQVKAKGEAIIEEWARDWAKVGDVSDKMRSKVENAYQNVVSKAYESLGISKTEQKEKEFANKLTSISHTEDPERELSFERRRLNKQIKEAEGEVRQLEDKLAFFKFSDDSNPLKKELLNRIDEAKLKTEAVREKRKRVDLLIKEHQHAASEDIIPEEAESVTDESQANP
ncbi:MAG: hypothetical protein Salg2KO_05100 [Salibacteraceae bacterium]